MNYERVENKTLISYEEFRIKTNQYDKLLERLEQIEQMSQGDKPQNLRENISFTFKNEHELIQILLKIRNTSHGLPLCMYQSKYSNEALMVYDKQLNNNIATDINYQTGLNLKAGPLISEVFKEESLVFDQENLVKRCLEYEVASGIADLTKDAPASRNLFRNSTSTPAVSDSSMSNDKYLQPKVLFGSKLVEEAKICNDEEDDEQVEQLSILIEKLYNEMAISVVSSHNRQQGFSYTVQNQATSNKAMLDNNVKAIDDSLDLERLQQEVHYTTLLDPETPKINVNNIVDPQKKLKKEDKDNNNGGKHLIESRSGDGHNENQSFVPLQMLVYIERAVRLESRKGKELPFRNAYVAYKIYSTGERVKTHVRWRTNTPYFDHKMVFPIGKEHIKRMEDIPMVLELWDKTETGKDELLGLLKLSMAKVPATLIDKETGDIKLVYIRQSQSLVLVHDEVLSVKDIRSENENGQLQVVVAVGTSLQVSI